MTFNKRPADCWQCGDLVPEGQGRLFRVDPDDEAEFGFQSGWLVEHTDGQCGVRAEARRREDAAAKADALAKRLAIDEVIAVIKGHGDQPAGSFDLQGEWILDSQNIHGGGDWFVVTDDEIWYCQNNGSDGADWRLNNVRSGGAGAIGWRMPRTPDVVKRLHDLESLIMPQAVIAKQPSAVRAYDEIFAASVDPAVWARPDGGEAIAPPWGAYVPIQGGAVLIGHGDYSGMCLAAPNPDHERYPIHGFVSNNYALALPYDQTLERLGEYASALPDWATLTSVEQMLALNHKHRFSTLAVARDHRLNAPPGPVGRYRVAGEGYASCARDALWTAMCLRIPLSGVTFDPDVTPVHIVSESRFTGRPWALWSDDVATRGEWHSPLVASLSADAASLVGVAIYHRHCPVSWRSLLGIVSISSQQRLAERETGHGHSSGEKFELDELVTLDRAGVSRTLYRVTLDGWAFNGEGDEWHDRWLFDDRDAAQRTYEDN
ncbi:MAG: hypothetical protein ACYDAG_16035 [Chloroflexota bacterium]